MSTATSRGSTPGAVAATPSDGPAASGRRRGLRALLVVVGVLGVAALSLLPLPAAPSYDPWAWLVWGREITRGELSTVAGPSWKPLTVAGTVLLAPFGDAAPQLWLVVGRAGAIATLLMLWRLGRRLGAPSAGLLAAAALALTPWWLRNAAVGNSEALMAALALGMLDRHLAGRYAWAFVCGTGCALLRPEAWPFLFLYGLGLAWVRRREVGVLALVAAGFLLQPLLWLVPERIGSGAFLRAAQRARTPDPTAATFADNPALTVLLRALGMLPPVGYLGILAAVGLGVAALRRRRTGRPPAGPAAAEPTEAERARSRRALLVVAGVAVVWTGGVMAMTVGGFSGNLRYLVMPVVLVLLCSLVALSAVLGRLRDGPRRAALLAAGVLAILPGAAGFGAERERTIYQRAAIAELPGVAEQTGGAARLLRCGEITTNRYLVPALAWHLEIPTRLVDFEPDAAGATLLSTRTIPGQSWRPSHREYGVKSSFTTTHWRVASRCRDGTTIAPATVGRPGAAR